MVKDDARKVNELILKIRQEGEGEFAPYSLSQEESGVNRADPVVEQVDDGLLPRINNARGTRKASRIPQIVIDYLEGADEQ